MSALSDAVAALTANLNTLAASVKAMQAAPAAPANDAADVATAVTNINALSDEAKTLNASLTPAAPAA